MNRSRLFFRIAGLGEARAEGAVAILVLSAIAGGAGRPGASISFDASGGGYRAAFRHTAQWLRFRCRTTVRLSRGL
jgi:hypothetical protein